VETGLKQDRLWISVWVSRVLVLLRVRAGVPCPVASRTGRRGGRTFNWHWLVDGLQAAGFVVHLANTTAIRKYDGLKYSGNKTDACYLAHLLSA
jgi:transposase